VYRAPSFPLFPFGPGDVPVVALLFLLPQGDHVVTTRCAATCPLLPSPGPASSAPGRRPSFVLRPFPPAKRRSCCPPFSAVRPGGLPDVLCSCTLRTVLGAGGRCRPWFRPTGALRGRISISKLVFAGLSRAPLIAAADAGASVLQPKGDLQSNVTKKTLFLSLVIISLLVTPLLLLQFAISLLFSPAPLELHLPPLAVQGSFKTGVGDSFGHLTLGISLGPAANNGSTECRLFGLQNSAHRSVTTSCQLHSPPLQLAASFYSN
jgi:hypothetical protein